MAKKLTKISVLASVLVAGCILGVQKVYAEETTTNTIAVNQSTTEVGVSNLTTIPATEMASDTTPQTVITEQESLDTFSETEGAQEQQSLITSTDSTTVATEDSINSEVTEKVTDEASSTQKTQLDLVDEQASQETKELFDYLKTKAASKEILFGQQHALDEGVTLTGEGSRAGSTESEVKNAIGDYPAVFGWDTLALDGHEKPGVEGDKEQSLANVIQSMKTAHELGGIVVLSMHPYNFVTGGNFNDTSGNVVSEILPGGSKNQEFNSWLDNIAALANGLTDKNGYSIPLLFRPFHEQTGSWFWWGASTTSTEQYKALYRYTVEYLRDQKAVHNILYIYSPNTTAPEDREAYLKTYPGDEYVDILGIDSYDSKENAGSEQFLTGLIKDLTMITQLAEQKAKVAVLTEFGYSAQGIKEKGNTLDWYSRVFNAIQADEEASKIAYMLTWANFGLPNNLYIPYKDINGTLGGDHELLGDFEKFYKDSNTVFAKEVGRIYQTEKTYQTLPNVETAYQIRPADGDILKQENIQVVVKTTSADDKVIFQVGDQDFELFKSGDFFTNQITLPQSLDNQALQAHIRYYHQHQLTKEETITLYTRFSEKTASPLVVDQFEDYFGESNLLERTYSSNGDKIQMSLSEAEKASGNYGMAYHFEVADKGYAGRQLSFDKNWEDANALSFWFKHGSYPQHLTVQIRVGNVSYEKNIELNNAFEGTISLPLAEFLPASWESNQAARIDKKGLKSVTQLAFYLGGDKGSGTLYFDDIQATTVKEFPEIEAEHKVEKNYQAQMIEFDKVEEGWNGPSVETGNGVLKANVSARDGIKTEISLQKGQDLSSYNWYVMKVKSDQVLQAKLYVKVGDSWQWVNNDIATVNGDWTNLIFDISQIAERNNTREIGVEFLGQGGAEQANIEIDSLAFVAELKELETKTEPDDNKTQEDTNSSEIKQTSSDISDDNIKQENKEVSSIKVPQQQKNLYTEKTTNRKKELVDKTLPSLSETGDNKQNILITVGLLLLSLLGLLPFSHGKEK